MTKTCTSENNFLISVTVSSKPPVPDDHNTSIRAMVSVHLSKRVFPYNSTRLSNSDLNFYFRLSLYPLNTVCPAFKLQVLLVQQPHSEVIFTDIAAQYKVIAFSQEMFRMYVHDKHGFLHHFRNQKLCMIGWCYCLLSQP